MKPYLYIDEDMGLLDKGIAFTKFGPRGVFLKEFEALANLGIALDVQLCRLRSHQPLKTSSSNLMEP